MGTELKKLQDKRAKTKTERHQQRKAELSRRYEIEVTPDLSRKMTMDGILNCGCTII
ncbi:hypothetical protein [Nostoc sp.]|uniref:hypothetical protein n=1 Tax=Nostoc sp. TaxID=1180 RepID=UPI002FF8EA13